MAFRHTCNPNKITVLRVYATLSADKVSTTTVLSATVSATAVSAVLSHAVVLAHLPPHDAHMAAIDKIEIKRRFLISVFIKYIKYVLINNNGYL